MKHNRSHSEAATAKRATVRLAGKVIARLHFRCADDGAANDN